MLFQKKGIGVGIQEVFSEILRKAAIGKTPHAPDRSSNPTLVVDLDRTAVRVVERRPSPQGEAITWGVTPLDRGKGKSYRDVAAAALRKLLTDHKITTRTAHLLVSGPSTVAMPMTLPPMPAKELEDAVRWSAVRALPFPVEEAILDHRLLPGTTGEEEQTVLVAAVHRPFVMEAVGVLMEAGLTPVQVSIIPLALAGIMQALPVEPDEANLCLDLRPHAATLTFCRGRDLRLVRLVTPDAEAAAIDQEEEDQLKRLIDEIWLSLAYYQERFPEEKIHRLWIAGPLNDLQRVEPALRDAVGIPVECVDLSTVFPEGKDGPLPPGLAAAAGVFLEPWEMNLLPLDVRRAPQMKMVRTWTRYVATAALLGILAWIGIENLIVRYKRQEVADQQAVLQRLTPLAQELTRTQEARQSRIPQLHIYEEPLAYSRRWLGALKELSALTPPAVTITALESNNTEGIKVKGLAFADKEPSEVALSEFMTNLSHSPYFQNVQLRTSKEAGGYPVRTLEFDLVVRWK